MTKEETNGRQKRYQNDRLMIVTLSVASILTFIIYVIPDWVFLEILTRDFVRVILTILGIDNYSISPGFSIPEVYRGVFPFIEATKDTPGIFLTQAYGEYWIVKACTGMQAGALLLSIIIVSNARKIDKLNAGTTFFVLLFIGNSLRIAFHLWLTVILVQSFGFSTADAFYWAHDVLSKIIGFFGTIFFALIIEKFNVPVIDTFSEWLDWIWWRTVTFINKIT